MRTLLLSTALVAAGALAAAAQEQAPEENPDLLLPEEPPAAADPMVPPEEGQADMMPEPPPAPVAVASATASEITGAAIVEPSGETIGNVSDLVISAEGQVTEIVVDVGGGFLGIGSRSVVLPMSDVELQRTADGGPLQLLVPISREALEAAPPYQEG